LNPDNQEERKSPVRSFTISGDLLYLSAGAALSALDNEGAELCFLLGRYFGVATEAAKGSRGSDPRPLGLTMGRLLDRTFGVRPRASRIVHALGLDQPSNTEYHRSIKTPNRNGLIRRGERHFLLGLIAQTEALQERRCLGILHSLPLCSGVLYGRDIYSCILLSPDLFSGILHRLDLCPRILPVTDVSVYLHGPDLSSGILHNLC
jgi:hypothetical protein